MRPEHQKAVGFLQSAVNDYFSATIQALTRDERIYLIKRISEYVAAQPKTNPQLEPPDAHATTEAH